MKRMSRLLVLSLLVWSIILPTTASAAGTLLIYPGAGLGSVRLGWTATQAVNWLKTRMTYAHSGRDTRYAGQTVYYYYFGSDLGNGRHAVEVYAKPVNGVRRVFIIQINSALGGSYTLRTAKYIKCGSTETALKRAYGSSLRRYAGSNGWARYALGTNPRTDFWVRDGKVRKILVAKY